VSQLTTSFAQHDKYASPALKQATFVQREDYHRGRVSRYVLQIAVIIISSIIIRKRNASPYTIIPELDNP
jgi:hypothetical protein